MASEHLVSSWQWEKCHILALVVAGGHCVAVPPAHPRDLTRGAFMSPSLSSWLGYLS